MVNAPTPNTTNKIKKRKKKKMKWSPCTKGKRKLEKKESEWERKNQIVKEAKTKGAKYRIK